MPRSWISHFKKNPQPSNLHTTYLSRYSMRWYSQTKYFPNGSFFLRIYKLVNTPFFLEVCKFEKILPVGTRLDISLKKLPRPSNLHTTYLSRYSMRWYSQKKYFPNGSIFFPIYKLLKKKVYLEVCKLKNKYFRLENIFFANIVA